MKPSTNKAIIKVINKISGILILIVIATVFGTVGVLLLIKVPFSLEYLFLLILDILALCMIIIASVIIYFTLKIFKK